MSPRKKKENSGPVLRAFELQHRERSLLRLLTAHPNTVVRSLAVRKEAGWEIGRLYLVGMLDHSQYQAAEHLEKITKAYEGMLNRFGAVKAANYGGTGGASPEDLSVTAQKRMARAKKKYQEAYDLLNQCGHKTEKAVVDALREDSVEDLELLRNGLSVLAAFIKK